MNHQINNYNHHMTDPEISIIVCTYNRSEMLRLALKSLANQKMPSISFEVVVVDNASTDATKEVVNDFVADSRADVIYYYEPAQGVANARNRGLEQSRGSWIAFFDDDQIADPNWLSELMLEATARQARSIGGSVLLQMLSDCHEEPVGITRRMLGEAILGDQPKAYGRKDAPGAGNWLLHREIFEQVGLFNSDLEYGGEDTDLYRRVRSAGIQSRYTPAAVVHHLIPKGRLEEDHLQRTSMRIGSHVAQREYLDYGKIAFTCLLPARFLQGLVLFRTRVAWNHFIGRTQQALAQRCGVWRCRGYWYWGLKALLPGWFTKVDCCGGPTFRDDRIPSGRELNTVKS